MCSFAYKNYHPLQLFVSDCVKRSIVAATGLPYMEVQRGLNRMKRKTGVKVFNEYPNPVKYIEEELGAKRIAVPAGASVAELISGITGDVSLVIATKRHWTAGIVENGRAMVVDTWNTCAEKALEAWVFPRRETR